jgi:transposase
MLKTMQYRLKPTKTQTTRLDSQLEECRWLYNHFLAWRRDAWKERQESLSYYAQVTMLPVLKQERQALRAVHSQVLQNVAVRIDLAFKAFFRRYRAGAQTPCPKFLHTDEKDLKRTQRKLSAVPKGTPERAKRRKIVARVHERIANRRSNFCHQESRSQCGHREKKTLAQRLHRCVCCGVVLDRDHNAALNILRLGQQSLGFP